MSDALIAHSLALHLSFVYYFTTLQHAGAIQQNLQCKKKLAFGDFCNKEHTFSVSYLQLAFDLHFPP